VNAAYAHGAQAPDKALSAKAAFFGELGVRVHLCGEVTLP
jgi:hypothetical protein